MHAEGDGDQAELAGQDGEAGRRHDGAAAATENRPYGQRYPEVGAEVDQDRIEREHLCDGHSGKHVRGEDHLVRRGRTVAVEDGAEHQRQQCRIYEVQGLERADRFLEDEVVGELVGQDHERTHSRVVPTVGQ
jgi:hypothetical protein